MLQYSSVKKILTTTGRQFDTRADTRALWFFSLEDATMKSAFKTLVLSSAALCATAAFAASQARVNVPFSFTAKGESYPAGTYKVVLNDSHSFVTLESNADAAKHLTWSVGPAEAAKTTAVIKFDEVGADYALRSIQFGERITPNLDTHQKRGISATTSIGGQ